MRKFSHKTNFTIMAFLILFSMPLAFAQVDMAGVDIFCDNETILGFIGLIPFLEICPIDGISPVDTDGDGLLDDWEINGIDGDGDGIPDFFLNGANPQHKDIFVEVDYMEFHRPSNTVINNLVEAFTNSPVPNPDGTPGITLHLELDEQIVHEPDWIFLQNGTWPTYDTKKVENFGTPLEKTDLQVFQDKIRPAKFMAYRYMVLIHNQIHSGAIIIPIN